MGFVKTPLGHFLLQGHETIFRLHFHFSACYRHIFLIIVNQSAFIFEFRGPSCAKVTNLADSRAFAKGVAQIYLKNQKMQAEIQA